MVIEANSNHHKKLVSFFSKNFDGDTGKLKELFDLVIEKLPSKRIYIIENDNKILGALVLVERLLFFDQEKFTCCGLSFMAKEKSNKDNSIVTTLINKVLQECNKSTFGIGFASKKMDNFWYRYGFIGVDNFSQVAVPIRHNIHHESLNYNLCDFDFKKDFKKINQIYLNTHTQLGFNFIRNKESWNYAKKNNNESAIIKLIKIDCEIIGYIIFRENIIFELGYDKLKGELIKKILIRLFSPKYSQIILCITLNHPIFSFFSNHEYKVEYRNVIRGGHIARINNVKEFCEKIKHQLERQLVELNVVEYDFNFHGIKFSFKRKSLLIGYSKDFVENDIIRREFTKLIFGFHDFDGINKLLFNRKNIRIPIFDHF